MFMVKLFSGAGESALNREDAVKLARTLLPRFEGESLAWSGDRLIVVDRLGHFTSRWARLIPV
jgi:hypothetical protein